MQLIFFQTKFYFNYHRCTTAGAENMFLVRYIVFTFVPFGLVIIMYSAMIWRVRVEKLNSRRMLLVTFLVIFTGIVAWFPSIIANFGNINMNYEVSQILTVTLFYLNGVSDPIIYIFGFPSVKNYLRGITQRQTRRETVHTHISSLVPRSEIDGKDSDINTSLTVSPQSVSQSRYLRTSSAARKSRVSNNCTFAERPENKSFNKSFKQAIKATFTIPFRGSSEKAMPRHTECKKFRRFTVSSSSQRPSLQDRSSVTGHVQNSQQHVQNGKTHVQMEVKREIRDATRVENGVSAADVIQLDCLKDCTVVQNSCESYSDNS